MLMIRADGRAARQRLSSAYQGLSGGGMDRRGFLRQAGLGGAGLAALAPRDLAALAAASDAEREALDTTAIATLVTGGAPLVGEARAVAEDLFAAETIADVYVTADLRHHPVLEAREESRGGTPYVLDAGHWAMESLWLATARRQLLEALGEDPSAEAAPTRVEARVSGLRTEPWTFVAGANRARPQPGGVS